MVTYGSISISAHLVNLRPGLNPDLRDHHRPNPQSTGVQDSLIAQEPYDCVSKPTTTPFLDRYNHVVLRAQVAYEILIERFHEPRVCNGDRHVVVSPLYRSCSEDRVGQSCPDGQNGSAVRSVRLCQRDKSRGDSG